jgi:asparagine synthase (glutamine-hydrolysing)
MCGIAGIANSRLPSEDLAAALHRMRESLLHRGPDQGGSVLSPESGAGLASRRLSIVDLSTGMQPIANEDGTVHVAFNGEIYNHASLREDLEKKGHVFRSRCDTEVIVHLYEELGVECLPKLHGMFALAVLDSRSRRLLLARDGPGMKPLYYTRTPDGFLFASEVKALFASGLVEPEVDLEAIHTYLTVGFLPAPYCGFRGIRKLAAGEVLLLERGVLRSSSFWRFGYDTSAPVRTEREYADELESLLRDAVGTHLAADVPVGALLSGGWDSSLVASMAAEHAGSRLKTFSIVFPEDPDTDESRHSRLMSERLGSDHHEIEFRSSEIPELLPRVVRHLEEPCSAAPAVLGHQIFSLAAGHVKAVLSGEGADELFGGYRWIRSKNRRPLLALAARPLAAPLSRWIDHPRRRRDLLLLASRSAGEADAEWLRGFTRVEKRRLLNPHHGLVDPDLGPVLLDPAILSSCRDTLERRLAFDFTGRLPGAILFQGDKMSMAHSLEVRMPFLDRKVVEFALRLPSDMKVRNRQQKYILSLLSRRLPSDIRRRRKQGLAYPRWRFASQPLAGFARELLLDGASADGLLNRRYLESRLEAWLNPRYGEYRRVVMLLFLQSWWNEFFTSR